MPSRKQRRRREKLKRHEYEYVIETEEGEEIPVDRPPEREAKSQGRERKIPEGVVLDRRGRVLPKPSFQRVMKRTMILFPLIVLFILVAYKNVSTIQKALIAVELLVIFVPFSYFVDRMMYRAMQKRQNRPRR